MGEEDLIRKALELAHALCLHHEADKLAAVSDVVEEETIEVTTYRAVKEALEDWNSRGKTGTPETIMTDKELGGLVKIVKDHAHKMEHLKEPYETRHLQIVCTFLQDFHDQVVVFLHESFHQEFGRLPDELREEAESDALEAKSRGQ